MITTSCKPNEVHVADFVIIERTQFWCCECQTQYDYDLHTGLVWKQYQAHVTCEELWTKTQLVPSLEMDIGHHPLRKIRFTGVEQQLARVQWKTPEVHCPCEDQSGNCGRKPKQFSTKNDNVDRSDTQTWTAANAMVTIMWIKTVIDHTCILHHSFQSGTRLRKSIESTFIVSNFSKQLVNDNKHQKLGA